ncbi:MAG TPA: hypothetical protein VG820_01130, partial [Fimbriimonadaceae bacterium]|nr:hypothetical protein [Fimbriimonadaceae bacterium]
MRSSRYFLLALFAACAAAASAQVVDRGLPDTNLNNAAGASRSNVAWAYDYGNTGIEGDSFDMPTLGSGSWVINTVRTWVVVGGQPQSGQNGPGDEFSNVKLFMGPNGGNLSVASSGNFTGSATTDNADITVSQVQYNNGTEHDYQGSSGNYLPMYEIDFNNLNIAATSGQSFSFGVIGTANSNSYAWFNHASNAAFGGVPADGADGLVQEFDFSGNYLDSYSTNGAGWDKESDINVQVFATAVPEPASLLALGGAAALAL